MLAQRIYGLALGYEDINDHQRLRLDPLLATACNKTDPLGEDRLNPADRGIALAAPCTLNRLELSNNKSTAATSCRTIRPRSRLACCKWERVVCPSTPRKSWWIWTRWGIGCTACKRAGTSTPIMMTIVICRSTPLWATFRLWAQLRTADHEAAYGVVPALEKIVAAIRQRCRKARIIVRGDSGFCREEIMAWCEGQAEVYYCLGLAKNSVLVEKLGPAMVAGPGRVIV